MGRCLWGAFAVACVAVLLVGAAQAATLVQTGSCTTAATSAPSSGARLIAADRCAVTLDKFDPTLGSLSSVRLELLQGTSYGHSLTGFNPTGVDQLFTLGPRRHTEYTVALEGVPTVAAFVLESTTDGGPFLRPALGGEGTVDLGSLGGARLGPGNTFSYTGAENGFIGPGTFDAALILTLDLMITLSDPALSYARSVEMFSDLRLTYVYEPPEPPPGTAVPEPQIWALMIAGFGLAGGGLRRWRAAG